MAAPTPTQAELADISVACQRLWSLDHNRCEPNRDYAINLQSTRRQAERNGNALGPLFQRVSPDVFRRPTYGLFVALLDNYKRETGAAESFGARERQEMSDFLDACMQSAPLQYVHRLLIEKGLMGDTQQQWKTALFEMWFALYRREVANDTSGFEHTFIGEVDKRENCVKGMHNWLQWYIEESRGNVQYLGYLNPRQNSGGTKQCTADDRMVSVHFKWYEVTKEVSSIMMGSSPEFELALYTLCFIGGTEQNHVHFGGWDVRVRAYHIRARNGDHVGSCFPEIVAHTGPDTRPAAGAPSQAAYQQYQAPAGPQQAPAWQQQPPQQQASTWQSQPQQQGPGYQPAPSSGGSGLLGALVDLLAQLCSGGSRK